MTQVTNASIDTLISTQSAPLVRISDIDNDFPASDTNDRMSIIFSVNGYTDPVLYIELTAKQLSEPTVWGAILAQAIGVDGVIDAAEEAVAEITSHFTTETAPYSYEFYRELVRLLRVKELNLAKGV